MIDRRGARGDSQAGPGIVETSLVLGLAVLMALIIIVFFGGQLAAAIGVSSTPRRHHLTGCLDAPGTLGGLGTIAEGGASRPRGCPYPASWRSCMVFVSSVIASLREDDEGQGLAEYALILALIAIVAIVALIFLGNQVSQILSTVGGSI